MLGPGNRNRNRSSWAEVPITVTNRNKHSTNAVVLSWTPNIDRIARRRLTKQLRSCYSASDAIPLKFRQRYGGGAGCVQKRQKEQHCVRKWPNFISHCIGIICHAPQRWIIGATSSFIDDKVISCRLSLHHHDISLRVSSSTDLQDHLRH